MAEVDRLTLKRKADAMMVSLRQATCAAKRGNMAAHQQKKDTAIYCQTVASYTESDMRTGCTITPKELALAGWKWKMSKAATCAHQCGGVLAVVLPDVCTTSYGVYSACVNKIRENMLKNHKVTCPGRTRLMAYRTVQPSREELIQDVKSRIGSLESLDADIVIPEDATDAAIIDGVDAQLSFICLLGWKLSKRPANNEVTATCELCTRSLMLLRGRQMDPIACHYAWCPVTEEAEDGGTNWRNDLKVLSNGPKKMKSLKDILALKRRFIQATSTSVTI